MDRDYVTIQIYIQTQDSAKPPHTPRERAGGPTFSRPMVEHAATESVEHAGTQEGKQAVLSLAELTGCHAGVQAGVYVGVQAVVSAVRSSVEHAGVQVSD